MYYPELSKLIAELPFCRKEIVQLDNYLASLDKRKAKNIFISIVLKHVKSEPKVLQEILNKIVGLGLLDKKYRIMCYKHFAGIDEYNSLNEIPHEVECDFCEENHEVRNSDIIEFFILNKVQGKKKLQKKDESELNPSSIDQIDTKIKEGLLSNRELPSGLRVQEKPIKKISSLEELNPFNSLPLLEVYSNEEKSRGTDLSKFIIIMIPHFLEDLYGFLQAFEKVKGNPENVILLHKKYPYPKLDEIKENLSNLGFKIFSLEEKDKALNEAISLAKINSKRIIIVEDGGYLTPLLHDNFKENIGLFKGAVEQTTKGISRDKQTIEKFGSLEFPVLSVASSKIKKEFESPAVGETVVRNIKNILRDKKLSGKETVVIGYGTIGKEIAKRMKDAERMRVSVYDRDEFLLTRAREDGFKVDEYLPNLLKTAWLVIGATGNMSIDEDEILCLQNGCILVSTSSDQEEIGIQKLEVLSKKTSSSEDRTEFTLVKNDNKIIVLGNGYPINFVGSEGVPNEIIDLVLTEIYLSTIYLATSEKLENKIDYNVVDEIAKERKLIERFHKLHN